MHSSETVWLPTSFHLHEGQRFRGTAAPANLLSTAFLLLHCTCQGPWWEHQPSCHCQALLEHPQHHLPICTLRERVWCWDHSATCRPSPLLDGSQRSRGHFLPRPLLCGVTFQSHVVETWSLPFDISEMPADALSDVAFMLRQVTKGVLFNWASFQFLLPPAISTYRGGAFSSHLKASVHNPIKKYGDALGVFRIV